jgi:precorrin-2 dehydrogenase/sirohydrochlorin ferrochelatase
LQAGTGYHPLGKWLHIQQHIETEFMLFIIDSLTRFWKRSIAASSNICLYNLAKYGASIIHYPGETSMSYPILLDLRGRRVVAVGGGRVSARKVSDLLTAGADVTVISPALCEELAEIRDRFAWREMEYAPGMLTEIRPLLVFTATDSPDVNQQVAGDARALGILVNTTDNSKTGDFTNMATIRRGEITIGLATGGASPALTAHLHERLESAIGDEYAILARWLGELRPLVKAQVPQEQRAALWQAILASEVLAHLRDGDEAGARAMIDALILNATKERD